MKSLNKKKTGVCNYLKVTCEKEVWILVHHQNHALPYCHPKQVPQNQNENFSALEEHFWFLLVASHLYHDQLQDQYLQVDELDLEFLQEQQLLLQE